MTLTNFKKAAMFGLDARIALAIFGALSVISGAALYSAIKQAKVIAEVTQMNEYAKALEAYILDTGGDLPFGSGLSADTQELISSTASGWNGPYIDGSDYSLVFVSHPKYTWFTFDLAPDDSFTYSPDVKTCKDASNAGKTCYYWLVFDEMPDQMAIDLEAYIDGDNDPANGKFRYGQGGRPAGSKITYYKLQPTITKY
tara:strand:+ start:1992 stop:2588 length:597 start_codon:yes stop_codon:yes gene_type:complete